MEKGRGLEERRRKEDKKEGRGISETKGGRCVRCSVEEQEPGRRILGLGKE
jgi:hypothetical protein